MSNEGTEKVQWPKKDFIIDESRNLQNQVSNTSQKSIVKQYKDFPKPKRGKWIVRLERIDLKLD